MTDQTQPKALYGFYSAQGAKIGGTSFYSTPDGGDVEVSCVCPTPEGAEQSSMTGNRPGSLNPDWTDCEWPETPLCLPLPPSPSELLPGN